MRLKTADILKASTHGARAGACICCCCICFVRRVPPALEADLPDHRAEHVVTLLHGNRTAMLPTPRACMHLRPCTAPLGWTSVHDMRAHTVPPSRCHAAGPPCTCTPLPCICALGRNSASPPHAHILIVREANLLLPLPHARLAVLEADLQADHIQSSAYTRISDTRNKSRIRVRVPPHTRAGVHRDSCVVPAACGRSSGCTPVHTGPGGAARVPHVLASAVPAPCHTQTTVTAPDPREGLQNGDETQI